MVGQERDYRLKISSPKNQTGLRSLESFATGDVFKWEEDYFMRTNQKELKPGACLNLRTGWLSWFTPNNPILLPVHCQLTEIESTND